MGSKRKRKGLGRESGSAGKAVAFDAAADARLRLRAAARDSLRGSVLPLGLMLAALLTMMGAARTGFATVKSLALCGILLAAGFVRLAGLWLAPLRQLLHLISTLLRLAHGKRRGAVVD